MPNGLPISQISVGGVARSRVGRAQKAAGGLVPKEVGGRVGGKTGRTCQGPIRPNSPA